NSPLADALHSAWRGAVLFHGSLSGVAAGPLGPLGGLSARPGPVAGRETQGRAGDLRPLGDGASHRQHGRTTAAAVRLLRISASYLSAEVSRARISHA